MRWRDFAVGPLLARRSPTGEVRLAVDLRSGATVALRFFLSGPRSLPAAPFPAGPAGSLARLLRVESSAGSVAVASELALGPTVEHLLLSAQPAPVAAGVAAQALRGLASLHAAGRAHGRLHPGNLILDVQTREVRVVDLAAFAVLGPTAGADPRKAYRPPGAASRDPEPRDDVYAVGQIAEALLRGGPPLGAWAPLSVPAQSSSFVGWMRRCQGLGREPAFATAAEALDAIQALDAAATSGVARLRPGPWVAFRRRAERTIARWKARGLPARASSADLLDFLSSLRAASLWRGLALSAAGSVVLAAIFAAPAAPTAAATFPEDGCVDAARAAALTRASPPPAGTVAIEISAPPEAALALDGCPVEAGTTRLAAGPGPHELRARWEDRVVAETIDGLGPFDLAKTKPSPPADVRGSVETRPSISAPSRGPLAPPLSPREEGPSRANLPKGSNPPSRRARGKEEVGEPVIAASDRIIAALAAAVQSPPEVDPSAPWTAALVAREAAAVLAIARGPAAAPAARAALPDDLALVLDGLRAASVRMSATSGPCAADLARKTAAVLAVRRPDAPAPLREAVAALAAVRIVAAERAAAPGPDTGVAEERAIRDALGVEDSPLLDAAADEVTADPAARACAVKLSAPATDIATLADRAVTLAAGPFAGAPRGL